ncbi:MAG: hypothetical protein M3464_19470 [Chloroflexota bacterium]|nr:hypothetical protein [Chloroflexota bacterium]
MSRRSFPPPSPSPDPNPRGPRGSTLSRYGRPLLIAAVMLIVAATAVAFVAIRNRSPELAAAPTVAVPDATTVAASQANEAPAARALVPEAVGQPLQVYPAGALHVVGQERFAVGLVDPESGPIETGTVDLLFFKLVETKGTLTETLPAPFLPYGVREAHAEDHDDGADEITGIYVARPRFDAPGNWGVVARVTMLDGSMRAGQRAFAVEAENLLPGPGDAAIPSKTLIAKGPEEIAAICTADPVDNMHALSLDDALKNGKPTVVLFATPALCASRTCGPSLEAAQELQRRYGTDANFIHVEIYPGADSERPAAAVAEWDLPSEPWLFLIDTEGKVVERFEGGIGLTELDPAVWALVR